METKAQLNRGELKQELLLNGRLQIHLAIFDYDLKNKNPDQMNIETISGAKKLEAFIFTTESNMQTFHRLFRFSSTPPAMSNHRRFETKNIGKCLIDQF